MIGAEDGLRLLRHDARVAAACGAAEADDRADLEVFAHRGEPPKTRFVLAP